MQAYPSYQPQALEDFATQLEAHARSVARGLTIVGALVGGAVGAVLVAPMNVVAQVPPTVGIATALLGVLAGGLLGRSGGRRRAHVHRLHAQAVLCQLHAQRATLAIWRLLRTQQEQSREPHQPVARAVPEPARVAAPNAPHAPVAVQPEPVSHQANPPLVEATLALSEPAGPALTPAVAEPAVGAVVPLVQSQPPAAELHPLFPPHSGAVAAATRADGPAYDAPPLVPPATQQPEPVNPWIVPPLAPPANGSA